MYAVRAAVVRSLAAAIVLTTALVACGGSDDQEPVATAADGPKLDAFDIYAIGSADGNELQADVYGITLNPLRAYRLTVDKRVSWLSADRDLVVVAAADDRIDKLGSLAEDGSIGSLAELGRPVGYSPEIQPDGTIRYQDAGDGEAVVNRYMSFDPKTGRTKALFRTKKDLNVVAAAPGGKFLEVLHQDNDADRVAVVGLGGDRQVFTMAERIASPIAGRKLIAVASFTAPDVNVPATATVILDPENGKTRTLEGWAPLAWTPDGTKLLVVRAGHVRLPDAELAVLDPADLDNPEILGTIPGLTVFQADWVARD